MNTKLKPTPEEIKIGRLEKKIKKLIQQRDHFKQEVDRYFKLFSDHQWIERRYRSYNEFLKEKKELADLKARVTEQELLIKALIKEKHDDQT